MDEWSTPTTSDTPHGPRDGVQELLARLTKAIRDAEDMRNNLLKTAGLSVSEAGLTIGSELLVTGNTRIEGTLSLPAGIIDNEALANPITLLSDVASESGLSMPAATLTDYSEATVVVPAGFNAATALCVTTMVILNDTASTQYITLQSRVTASSGEVWGGSQIVAVAAGFQGSLVAIMNRTLGTVAEGTNVTGYARAWASAAIGVHVDNYVGTEVVVTFFRN